ncbi:MAG: hypothetical protein EZS28_039482, partial [Streblomastix strix]
LRIHHVTQYSFEGVLTNCKILRATFFMELHQGFTLFVAATAPLLGVYYPPNAASSFRKGKNHTVSNLVNKGDALVSRILRFVWLSALRALCALERYRNGQELPHHHRIVAHEQVYAWGTEFCNEMTENLWFLPQAVCQACKVLRRQKTPLSSF